MKRSSRFEFSVLFFIFISTTRHFCSAVPIINGCPEHFARIGMHCTTIVLAQMPWTKADAECRTKASLMFMIKDQATYDQLLNASPVNASDPNAAAAAGGGGAGMPPLPGNLMMGLKFTASSKTWAWVDGAPYNPATDWAMWSTGKAPDPPAKDACVVWKKKGKDLKWDLADCSASGLTICYAIATSKIQTCPDKYMQEQDLCIMPVMKLDSSYTGGSAECKANGDATVAMLKKEDEYKKIQSLGGGIMDKLPVPVWMGLKFTSADGKWKWSDGEEYHMGTDWGLWKDKKPPATPGTDMCVTMMKGADGFDWVTEDCNAQKGLTICSKKATADPTGESTRAAGAAPAPAAAPGAAPAPAAPSGGGGGGGKSGAMTAIASAKRVIEVLTCLIVMNYLL